MNEECDVLVVGGGPVGLWLACELALAKVRVVVLERRSERIAQSRALTMHGRTLEMFSLRGLAERFLARGRPIPTGHFAGLDTRLDFAVFDTRFPFTLFLPQTMTEQLLEERARELGVDLRRGHTALAIEADEERISVVVAGEHGAGRSRMSARYLVGADGARSIVRQEAGIDFPGYPARRTMMMGDVVLDAPPPVPMLSRTTEAGGMMLVPLGDGRHHRIILTDPRRNHIPTSEPVTMAEFTASAERIAGADFQLRDPIWLSRFGDETRLAAHYRKGRILLAGDAAHIHLPAGGQGMNVGLQDAMNLGWKLASVVHGTAPDALLDSYERERRPVGESLHRSTLAQAALVGDLDVATLALRRTLDDLLRIPEVNRRLAEQTSGFGVVYPEPLFPAFGSFQHRPSHSGRRLADADLALRHGERTTLYRHLHRGTWVRLHFGAGAPPEVSGAPAAPSALDVCVARAPESLAEFASVWVRPDGYLAHVQSAE